MIYLSKHRETMIEFSLPSPEMGEQLVRVDKTENITQIGIIYYVWLLATALLYTITNISCLEVVNQLVAGVVHHAVSTISSSCTDFGKNYNCNIVVLQVAFIFLIFILFAKCITAPYLFKAPSRYNKRIQRTIFKKLLNTSMESINETKLSHILNLFMDTNIQGKFIQIQLFII